MGRVIVCVGGEVSVDAVPELGQLVEAGSESVGVLASFCVLPRVCGVHVEVHVVEVFSAPKMDPGVDVLESGRLVLVPVLEGEVEDFLGYDLVLGGGEDA